MKKPSEKLITLIEAVYDLEPQDAAWIQNLLAVAAPSFEGSLALGAATYTRDPAGAR